MEQVAELTDDMFDTSRGIRRAGDSASGLGGGSTKVAGTVSGKALAAGFFSCFNVVDGTVVFRTPFLVPNT